MTTLLAKIIHYSLLQILTYKKIGFDSPCLILDKCAQDNYFWSFNCFAEYLLIKKLNNPKCEVASFVSLPKDSHSLSFIL